MRQETIAARDALRNAIARLDSFGAPSDDAKVCLEEDTFYELLAEDEDTDPNVMEDRPLTLGHLRDILTHLNSGE